MASAKRNSGNKKRTALPLQVEKRDTMRRIEEKRVDNLQREQKRKVEAIRDLTRDAVQMLQEDMPIESIPHNINRRKLTPTKSVLNKETDDKADDNTLVSKVYLTLEESPNDVFVPKKHGLLLPIVDLPESISDRLGLSVQYLLNKQNQQWDLVLNQLQQEGGFVGLPVVEVKKFIYQIPYTRIGLLIPQLEKLLEEADIKKSSKIINHFIKGLSVGPTISEGTLQVIEQYAKYITDHRKRLKLLTYQLLVQVYGKCGDMDKINKCLKEMQSHGLKLSKDVYSNILKTSVYKKKDHKLSVELFDSMRFLLLESRPTTETYQDIIVSYVNNGDIEKALDLYQQMLDEGVEPNQQILVALARGCCTHKDFKFKSWDFVFDIYKKGWQPSLETFEYMIYLAARDGDVSLARALYLTLNESKAVTSRSFAFLLLAYSKSALKVPEQERPLPTLTMHEDGRLFRRNILLGMKFPKADEGEPAFALPLLPVVNITSRAEILAETSALWAHSLIFNRQFLNKETVNSYLNVAAEMGGIEDFKDRFDNATFLDPTGLQQRTRVIIEEVEEAAEANFEQQEAEAEQNLAVSTTKTKAPILMEINNEQTKIQRSSLSYVIALKAAAYFNDYDFAKKVWTERGDFRKTDGFRNLLYGTRKYQDFEFASAMITCMARMNMLDDSMAILLSVSKQFKWTWKELHEVYNKCAEVGNVNYCKTIKGVIHSAQLKYHGKISKDEYRVYAATKGY
ncbi:Mitochondrial group I intron splicing factor ccm1 [Scheffersomyces spartinae]|uniref:Mitochondrial 15S rRNA processing factor CCM1 n=1 Tax=Scheffersomyces spartinae TaxID=45513 RepID=A0A9P7VB06_9ASCO|nr:Mitochondrial group I intron splicing factor ccm1 [Scheffersomyces spartinae]KAG7194079.1 Mitochondrial group I intron splicing factor ccm1 [Scheffersomyces spartinae]